MESSSSRPAAARPALAGRGGAAACVALVAAFGLLSWAVLRGTTAAFDQTVAADVVAGRTPALGSVAKFFTDLGSWPVLLGLSVVAAGALFLRTRRPAPSAALLVSTGVTAALVYLLKIAFGRSRPDAATRLGLPALDGSFPSGHTTNGTLIWVTVCLLLGVAARHRLGRVLAAGTGLLLAAGIGWSRVYLGYHWPTDVLAGWLLATAIVLGEMFLLINLTPPAQMAEELRGKARSTTASSGRPAGASTRRGHRSDPSLSHP